MATESMIGDEKSIADKIQEQGKVGNGQFNPQFGSFSLQVRRRTDQQSNFVTRTHADWKKDSVETQ